MTLFSSQFDFSQSKRIPASAGRVEYIEVELGVIHVTKFGEEQPIELVHGWPLSVDWLLSIYVNKYKSAYVSKPAFQFTKDQLIDFTLAEQLHKGLKNSYIVKFEDSGHALFVEEMGKINS